MKTKFIIGNMANGLILFGTGHAFYFLNPDITDEKPIHFNSAIGAFQEAQRIATYYPPGTMQLSVSKVFVFDEPIVQKEILLNTNSLLLVMEPERLTWNEMNEKLSFFDTAERLLGSAIYKN